LKTPDHDGLSVQRNADTPGLGLFMEVDHRQKDVNPPALHRSATQTVFLQIAKWRRCGSPASPV
jgi:hypothetical protein